ncbi:hypothetical protein KP806_03310 [Paenibacillus sp. N4]|uniref:hypothetical protein n=1 Tax=Paenibacillus vietnamensis TaxID=2590547 RepID=UPI001CD0CEBC|nr:hypothetical protein [Paenibacillus vietnamensis]MCA0754059.1 hypothetical protein [Paenibacillus vietnamensis]
MLGTWRWNVIMGMTGSVLTIVFSIGNNPVSVMLIRSVYAFIAFFVLAYVLRIALAFILQPPALATEQPEPAEDKGTQLDLQTPDETDDLNQLLKSAMQDGAAAPFAGKSAKEAPQFRPLEPPQLLSAKNTQPEELAKAIRHLTGE